MSRSPAWAYGLGDRREAQTLSHGSLCDAPMTRRRGVTLLELIVVLALLGLIFAIAAPSFVPPPASPAASAIVAARRRAVLRGEPVTVLVDGARVHVTPLGICIPESAPRSSLATWDAIGCAAPSNPSGATAR